MTTGGEITTERGELIMVQLRVHLAGTMELAVNTPAVPDQIQPGAKIIRVLKAKFKAEPADQVQDTVARAQDQEVVDSVNNNHRSKRLNLILCYSY